MTERIADLQYRMFDRMRHRGAVEAARADGSAPDFESLREARQCLIVSFKQSGEPVPTPVNFALTDDGKLVLRSEPRSAKMRRIRRDPRVRVCACNMRGKPTGPMVGGQAVQLPESENERADAILVQNWTGGMKVMERGLDRLPLELVYVEVEPAAPADAGEERSS